MKFNLCYLKSLKRPKYYFPIISIFPILIAPTVYLNYGYGYDSWINASIAIVFLSLIMDIAIVEWIKKNRKENLHQIKRKLIF